MTVQSTELGPQALALRLGEEEPSRGWVAFVAALLCTIGILNVIDGIAAVGGSQFFVRHASYILGDLGTWGWVLVAFGVCQGVAGVALLRQYDSARWPAAAFALLNMFVQLLTMPAAPLWSLAVFALDVIVVYGLIVRYGPHVRPV